MKKLLANVFIISFLFSINNSVCLGATAKVGNIRDSLDTNHPRLMLNDRALTNLKNRYKEDKVLQRYVKDVLDKAEACCEKPPLKYQKNGPRLLQVSRDCLDRTYALALAYRWTGGEKYAAKAKENLLTVCDFNDWNPSHFLDVAEMSHAVGLGYDWLYTSLDEGSKKKIKEGLIRNGLEPGLKSYAGSGHWFRRSPFNWNQVCNGGLIVGALAIADSDPQFAEKIVPAAIESIAIAIKTYGPDGSWPEGPGYWEYATDYTAYAIAALDTALGQDYALSKIEGLSKAGYFPIYSAGPTGLYLNYADSGEKRSRNSMWCLFWLSQKFRNPFFADDEHNILSKQPARPQHVIWYVPKSEGTQENKDLNRYFGGQVETAVFRSGWGGSEDLFIGIKAGFNQVNHGHLDLGNFELDALGVRWVRDLGSDNYNLQGYWEGKKGGYRWTYYRLNSQSHSVPLINNENQNELAKSRIAKFEGQASSPFAIVDFTEAYEKFVKKAERGVSIVGNGKAVLIQDEFELKEPCDFLWAVTTDANIEIKDIGAAVLSLGGKKLIAKILSLENVNFEAGSAEQKPPQAANKGVKRLMMKIPKAAKNIRVAVLLAPVWSEDNFIKSAQIKPLSDW
jgi:hypothetical protein